MMDQQASGHSRDVTEEPALNLPPGYYDAIKDSDMYQLPGQARDTSCLPPPVVCMPSALPIDQAAQLTAVDFFPTCVEPGNVEAQRCPKFLPFNTVMSAANNWLASNRSVTLVRCECIERMCNSQGEPQPEAALQHEPGHAIRAYVTGLRLWCSQEPRASLREVESVQLWYLNAMPRIEQRTIQLPMGRRRMFAASGDTGQLVPVSAGYSYSVPFVEPLPKFLERLNAWLVEKPLGGKICGVQSLALRCAMDQRSFDLDASCQWHMSTVSRMRIFYYRLFYIVGEPVRQEVGLQVFVPQVHPNYKPRMLQAPTRYEGYQCVLTRALGFAASLGGVQVTDVQTFTITSTDFIMNPVQIAIKSQKETVDNQDLGPNTVNNQYQLDGSMSYELLPASMSFREHTTIRVAYVKSQDTAQLSTGLPTSSGVLTSKLYLPDRISVKNYERLDCFLQRLLDGVLQSNAKVITAETVTLFVNPMVQTINTEQTYQPVLAHDGRYRLTAIRLIIDGQGFELAPSMGIIAAQQQEQGKLGQSQSSCCNCCLL